MKIPAAKWRREPNAPSPLVELPDELIEEILSFLPVKTLLRLRCVSKSWNTPVSDDPAFVKMHLKRSARNAHLTRMCDVEVESLSVVPVPVRRLLENPSTTFPYDPCYELNVYNRSLWLVGSCNGLLCMLSYYFNSDYRDYCLFFWNPATRRRSEELGYFCSFVNPLKRGFKFSFGCDNSTGTYKVVAFRVEGKIGDKASWRNEVRVFSLGDNCWRSIQSFPVVPLMWFDLRYDMCRAVRNDGVHLSGTVNWLALRNYYGYDYYFNQEHITTIEQFVIVSLDLSRETYTLLLPPSGFDEVPPDQPCVGVFMDCLCFSHDSKRTHFVLWQMKEFGVQESWTQFLKISCQNLVDGDELYSLGSQLSLFCLAENGDTLIFSSHETDGVAFIYNRKDNRVEQTRITKEIWWFWTKDYVESLVSTT